MARGGESRARVAVAIGALFLIAACGGGKEPSGPTTRGTDGSGGGTGSGGNSGGGSGSGGGTDAGGGTAGGGGGGTTAGGGTGGGTAGGGTGSGGGGDAGGTSVGGAGSSGGTACSALVAAPDAGRYIPFDPGAAATCWRATSSPSGELALGTYGSPAPTTAYYPSHETTFRLYPPDGSWEVGTVPHVLLDGPDLDPWFHPTGAGWAAIVHDDGGSPLALRSFDSAGGVLATTADQVESSAPDAHGGTVALARSFSVNGTTPIWGPTTLEWLDARGAVSRTVTLDADPAMLLVAWGTDHVLTLVSGADRLQARWYDGTGNPLTPWFDAGTTTFAGNTSLHLLVDGTIALGDTHAWRGTFRDGVAAVDPPPAWLAARPGTRLATIRNGLGYAVLPFARAGSSDQSTFEIVTAAGESCGKVTLPPRVEPGFTHSPQALDVGQDGTVLQTELRFEARPGGRMDCGFRWWPALLK